MFSAAYDLLEWSVRQLPDSNLALPNVRLIQEEISKKVASHAIRKRLSKLFVHRNRGLVSSRTLYCLFRDKINFITYNFSKQI